MPRSSKSKSHKQSKHSSKEKREYSDSEEDVKMKDRSIKEESSARASKDLGHSVSGDKRKFSSQAREGREGKDLSNYGNGEVTEEYVSSKRRKEKGDGGVSSDRWNGGMDESVDDRHVEKEGKAGSSKNDQEKVLRQKEAKVSGDSRSRSSKRHESGSGGVKKEEISVSGMEREDAKSGKSSESRKKTEVDSVRKESTTLKEKDHGSERERKRETDIEKKQRSQSGDVGEEKQGKHLKEHTVVTDRSVRSEVRHSDLDRDAEKKMRKRHDSSGDRDRYDGDDQNDEKQMSSRAGDRIKDDRHRDSKHNDGGYRDKYREDGDRDERHNKEEKYETDKDRRRREDKYREDGHSSRDNRRKDGKYRDDGDRDTRNREEKYHQHEDRDNRHKGYRVEVERESRHRDDKYREDNDRGGDDKYLEDRDKEKDVKRRVDRYREDGEEDRPRDSKYGEDVERDDRHNEKKYQTDFEKASMHREGKYGEDYDKDKRLRDMKYTDELALRDRSRDRSDAKHSKDETHATDNHSRKVDVHENSSPNYDDRASRYRDDQGRRRADDKEDRNDSRFQSSKEQYDLEKRAGTVPRLETATDRGKSSSRNSDLERSSNHSRRRSSPGSGPFTARDHYRQSKQEDPKYRDHIYEERVRRNRDYSGSAGVLDKITSTRSAEKATQKDDNYLLDGSAERRLKSDPRNTSNPVLDKSPSSTSNDRRHLGRPEVKRSLEVEDFALRSGLKDAKDFSGREGRGNRDLPVEAFAGDELVHPDGDTLSVSSPFVRGVPGGSTRLPPLLPFRPGVDNPSVVGSSEDDCRGKPGSRHRRGGVESNAGRFQGNSWRGVPTWPSPVANGFIFQHSPAHVTFPPVMQQFPSPPMFGVRPSMDLNHSGLPYHMPDADRFSSHGRPIGWRTPMDTSCSPFHTWDSNSSVVGDETNMYGRPEWDQYRNMPLTRNWEHASDMWKGGANRSASVELSSASHKEANSGQGPVDESLTCQSVQQSQCEQKHADLEAESKTFSQSSDVEKNNNTAEGLKILPHETCGSDSKMSRKDDTCFCLAYLSKLDISSDLTELELYEKCTSLLLTDQIMVVADADAPRMLYLEPVVEGKAAVQSRSANTSLIAAASVSVLEKAFSQYKEERVDVKVLNIQSKTSVVPPDEGKALSEDVAEGAAAAALVGGLEAKKLLHPNPHGAVVQVSHQKAAETEIERMVQNPEQPTIERVISMEVDVVSNIADEHGVEGDGKPLAIVEAGGEPCEVMLTTTTTTTGKALGNHSLKTDSPLLCPNVVSSDEAYGVGKPVESESVILSRIHHSPESTH
ncbi:unnamed protein product [Cuscuta campestris]|uniref:Zinc finger CCCH domain-containing protein 13-like n=1 Tax=Cuscuta campestris TaxID=132261 RepID=A0A484K7K1_9ASTE|nr:unnamed protein product [Cuscuta campestris]